MPIPSPRLTGLTYSQPVPAAFREFYYLLGAQLIFSQLTADHQKSWRLKRERVTVDKPNQHDDQKPCVHHTHADTCHSHPQSHDWHGNLHVRKLVNVDWCLTLNIQAMQRPFWDESNCWVPEDLWLLAAAQVHQVSWAWLSQGAGGAELLHLAGVQAIGHHQHSTQIPYINLFSCFVLNLFINSAQI